MSGYIDTHNHILPGLDDGAETLKEAVSMAKIAENNGISKIIATPHRNEYHASSAKEILSLVELLRNALKKDAVAVEVYPGNELRINPNLPGLLKEGNALPLAESNYILLEFPFDGIPFFAEEVIFRLRVDGWLPILAHAERIYDIQKKPDRLRKFIDMGCLVQMNSQSITGEHDRASKDTAVELLRRGWVDIMATDAHSADWRIPDFSKALKAAGHIIGKDAGHKLIRENPERIFTK